MIWIMLKNKNWLGTSMRILLSGGSGMLGKNILEHISAKQHQIYAPPSSEVNLLDPVNIMTYLKTNKIEFVLHCAGQVGGIQANIKDQVGFLNNNLLMGINMVNAAYQSGIKQLLNIGSSCMYPKDYINPLKEEYILNAPLEPTNEGYALAKITVAKLCECMSKQHGVAFKTLIPCNLYGRWDKFDDNHSHMIPAVIKKIYLAKTTGSSSVDIWGDGEYRREFMLAEDCADAVFFAIANFAKLDDYTNVGMDVDHTINEYYTAIAKVIGYKGSFKHDLTKPVGMKQKLVDTSKIHNLGWTAKHSLEDGVKETVDFYMKELNS
jgi:GDP-L-fucose synthase